MDPLVDACRGWAIIMEELGCGKMSSTWSDKSDEHASVTHMRGTVDT
jgi:hypothetical protein